MADEIKILGQLAAAATTVELLYEAPDLAQVTISTLIICNRTVGALTFNVSIHQADANPTTPDNSQYIYYGTSIAANSTLTLTAGLTLNQTDTIRTYASATGLTFSVFGVETSA